MGYLDTELKNFTRCEFILVWLLRVKIFFCIFSIFSGFLSSKINQDDFEIPQF